MSFVKNSVIMIGQSVITKAFGFILTAVLSRLLGPGDFGLYSLVSNTANSVYGVVRLGTDASLSVFSARISEIDDARTQKGDTLGTGFLLLSMSALLGASLCILFSAQIASGIFKQPNYYPWIATASVFVILQCISQFLYCIVVGFQLFKQYSKVMIISGVLGLGMTATAAFLNGPAGALLGLAVTQFVALLMLYRVVGKALKYNKIILRVTWFGKYAKNILNFGLPFYLSGLAMIPSVYFAQGLLARHGGAAELGGQRVIVALITLVSFVPSAIAPVMLHRLSSTVNHLRDDFNLATQRLLKYQWIFSVISSLLAALITPVLVNLIFGEQFLKFIPAAYFAIFSSSLATILGVVSSAAFAAGRVRLILFYTVVQAAVFLVVAALLIPTNGVKAYFQAEALGHCAIFIFLFFSLKKKVAAITQQRWFLSCLMISILFAIVMLSMIFVEGTSRTLIGFVGLLITCVSIYKYVLVHDEKSNLIETVAVAFLRQK